MSTVGLELEWADVDTRTPISPELGAWNHNDYTIVNSDGHANDPRCTRWFFGGEINTAPTTTAHDQAGIVGELAALLQPIINYRCNTHVHVKPDIDLTRDVNTLLRVAKFFRAAEPFVYKNLEPIPVPERRDYESEEAFAGAKKRYRRRGVSHHYRLPEARWEELVAATDPLQVYDAHAPLMGNGRRGWHIAPRPGMNLRSLWKHGTIEFRHFPGTADPEEVESCAQWCLSFVDIALDGGSVEELYRSRTWKVPAFRPYVHTLELGYLATTYK